MAEYLWTADDVLVFDRSSPTEVTLRLCISLVSMFPDTFYAVFAGFSGSLGALSAKYAFGKLSYKTDVEV